MPITAGIDIGSVFTKAVVLGGTRIISEAKIASKGRYKYASGEALRMAVSKAGIPDKDVSSIVATGMGASNSGISVSRIATEISCQSKGTYHIFPLVRTVIDIGGQAIRVIRTTNGKPMDFVLSERCATGSGRFLQVIAKVLQVDIEKMGPLSLNWKNKLNFSTGCAVFAESETVSRIAEGYSVEDILRGVHSALGSKIESLINRVGLEPECVLTGGPAGNIGLVNDVEEKLNMDLCVPPKPFFTGALGAALIALEET